MKPKAARIKCPICGREGDWLAGSYGPFCSPRCKLVDLGKWFGEEHVISQSLRQEEGAEASVPVTGPQLDPQE